MNPNAENVSLAIMVTYRPKFWFNNKSETFFFGTRRDEEGNYQWLPCGEYKNRNDKDLAFITNLPTLVPKLDQ
jgi:hypothetical protein